MDEKEKLQLISRITSGYTWISVGGEQYIVDTPTESLLNESINYYFDILKHCRFEEFLQKQHIEFVLVKNKLWSWGQEAKLKELNKSLEDCKEELYNSYGLPSATIKRLREQLKLIKSKQSEIIGRRAYLEQFTLDGFAEYSAELFLFSRLLLDSNYRKIDVDYFKLESIVNKYKSILLTSEQFREIARSDLWRTHWMTSKKFRRIGDEQKMLVMFTKMYDSVWESANRPVDQIIEDDDMLDGWFIHQRKEVEKERREAHKNTLEMKHGEAEQIFVFKNEGGQAVSSFTKDEISEVNEMNDTRGKIIRHKIDSMLDKQGTAREIDILEYRLEAEQEARNGR